MVSVMQVSMCLFSIIAVAASTACTNEITTVADFYAQKASFDLIVDVRTFSEYTGDGDATCNAAKADKCNMGHDPDMWMLTNADRTDKAVLYKVDGSHTVDPKIVTSLKACYGAHAATMKIAISCHSGSRSLKLQEALVAAGFSCGNMYNVRPGADGMFKADPLKLVKGNTMKGPWSCADAPPPPCTNEITTVADFYAKKASFDLIVDVRTLSEYTGDGDATCNAAKADKCNMGHDPDMWMLTNADRTDKAVLYKVNGSHTVDSEIVTALKACYGAHAATMKIAISCHSGARSFKLQEALVAAGFSCGNMYNVKPGADGMFKADPAKLVKGNEKKGPWSCAAAPFTGTSTSGTSSTSTTSTGTTTGAMTSSSSLVVAVASPLIAVVSALLQL